MPGHPSRTTWHEDGIFSLHVLNNINTIMNAKEFFYTVAEMREAQKAYFKTRDPQVFRAARKLENIIDKEIERVRLIVSQQDAKP